MRQLILGLGLLAVFGLAGCGGGGSGGADEKPNDDAASENNTQGDQASENTTSEATTYIVSLNAAVGGSFNITGQQEVNAGSVLSATVTPDTGYSIDSVTGCGGTLTDSTFTTAAIIEDCTVEASFSINSYSVTPMVGDGGSISPEAAQLVNYGSTTSFTVTPDTGYRIDSVTGCGGNLTDGTFTTEAITEDCTVEASFVFVKQLNDTGITLCGNYYAENEGPSSATLNCADTGATETADGIDADGNIVPAGQDAHYGRDALAAAGSLSKIGGGNAGFDFTRINSDGSEYTGSGDYATDPWSCVRDNVTGLVWEVKDPSNDIVGDSLHDVDDRYNWYNTDPATNGGADGFADDDGAICYGYNSADSTTFCNTQAYTARVNASRNGQGLCGATDWRMPKREELRSILDYGRIDPSIDSSYFPNARSGWYWTGSPVALDSSYSWRVSFYYGGVYDNSGRVSDFHVRLVRSGQ
jgi:hypothetical protein